MMSHVPWACSAFSVIHSAPWLRGRRSALCGEYHGDKINIVPFTWISELRGETHEEGRLARGSGAGPLKKQMGRHKREGENT